MDKLISIITLGCKVNKYESDCLAHILETEGYITTDQLVFAPIYIVNTCAVTNEAEKKSRQYIAKINKLNPDAKIIVCGCASEHNPQSYNSKKNVVYVVNNQRKDMIVNLIKGTEQKEDLLTTYNNYLVNPKVSQTRAYIKIQDGCNRFCSYCIIPYLRGRSVSRDINDVINEAYMLAKSHQELVIVGIDMSDYRIDGQLALPRLMKNLAEVPARIRLGSLEVSAINQEFMQILSEMPNFAPQFHLSLQSGDDFVLKKMNRKYSSKDYIKATELIYQYFPNANITTDIIVGFSYEEEENFLNTYNLAKTVKFGKIHCFPFSAKEGTIAYKYPDVEASVKKDRMKRLEELGAKLQLDFNSKFIGKKLKVLIEEKENEYFVGYSENYIKCYYSGNIQVGQIHDLVAIETFKEGVKVK